VFRLLQGSKLRMHVAEQPWRDAEAPLERLGQA
jgi:hypothetical protein